MSGETNMVDVVLGRLVLVDGQDRQYIFLAERDGPRAFPIVIGANEAHEIHRVLHRDEPPRPLTHQLAYSLIQALDVRLTNVDIIDLRHNTFFAQLTLENAVGDVIAVVDARPSDAIALALRARCQLRVAETVLEAACKDEDGEGDGAD